MPDLEIPYWARLLTLLVVLGSVAGIERWKRGEKATRWREYSFLLAAGVFGAVFGASFDQLSYSLSPEYFEFAKGIDPGEGFRLRVTVLGAQAGFFAGLVGGGMLLIANTPRADAPGLPYRRLAWHVFPVVACALVLSPIGSVCMQVSDYHPGFLIKDPSGFRTVWGLHIGLYVGALIGLVVASVGVRRARRAALPQALADALEEPVVEAPQPEADRVAE